MALINVTKEFQRHSLDDCEFIGVVEDNEDPEQLGRVKVRVIEVFGTQILTEDLPWAAPFRDFGFGAQADLSSFSVPLVGTEVVVKFHRGDVYSPVFSSIILSGQQQMSDYLTNYPFRYGMRDRNGNKTIVDTHDLTAQYSHISGNVFDILGLPNDPLAATFVSPNSFTVPGDKGIVYLVGKGVRLTITPAGGDPIYVYSTITNVTVGNDPTTVTIADNVVTAELTQADVTDSSVILTHPTGTVVKVDKEGSVDITINSNTDLPRTITLNCYDLNINADNDVNITAANQIRLVGGGSIGEINSSGVDWFV